MFQTTNQVALEFGGRSRLTEQIDQPPTPAFSCLMVFFQLQLCLRLRKGATGVTSWVRRINLLKFTSVHQF